MSNSSLLWSLQPPEGAISYLFGTMHISDRRVYQFCNHLYPFIDRTEVYVGEMDLELTVVQPPAPVYDMHSHLSPGAYLKLRRQLRKSFDLDIDQYAHLHPLLIMSAMTQLVLQNDHALSLDEHLWKYARKHNLETVGLESVDEQVSLLHSIKTEKLYAQIKKIGSHPSLIRKFTNKTLNLYLRGEIHALYKLTKASMQHLRKEIIYDRNIRMVERILNYDLNRPYFIAVGAGHLSGFKGLISLLRKQKWVVKQAHFQ